MRFAARPRTPSLRELCVELSDKVQMQGQLLQLATRPNETALLERMSRLSPADREFLLTLLNFDADARQALVAAARSPEITRLVVNAGRNPTVHAAMQTVARNPAIATAGLTVINGTGVVGWIARKAAGVLARRKQNNSR